MYKCVRCVHTQYVLMCTSVNRVIAYHGHTQDKELTGSSFPFILSTDLETPFPFSVLTSPIGMCSTLGGIIT